MSQEDISNDIIIRGQATLTWGDQFRFVLRKLVQLLWKYAAVMTVPFVLIWALFLPDAQWLDLRAHPLAALGDFAADAWPFYLGTLAALIVLMIASSYVAFRRLPDANRKLSYEVDAKGILTRDAADFALTVPWSSVTRTRDTSRILYLKTVPGAWRYLPWRAFAPGDREQVLRWAARERANSPPAT